MEQYVSSIQLQIKTTVLKKKIAVHDENGYNHGAESENV